ncbi:alanine--glyoxylate aminotransferase family protein [Cytobacillus oceanisediminis]|uniref:pyridoxal-phosphate-dependent aminotransferase family protein n=1 Tax=Cytobacillus TaxID=2675230 RepID=UPI00203F6F21|nr:MULTISPECIES: alanine--glyoxylate aminotransferase family protein [Cytobacillus]MCM3393373.1 alanine--glyoxylate aminotransferase family protein [Cytobacillus oceanisediminis]MCM3530472.1 alanine--glyoxylate aminotransferase family protein [Cytobacillus oceanisediminis]MCS0824179.1 alanine--glyoxylate aminotransferase family protein [Cytobacillus firmus]UQX54876.1 alanine--glyoxylate aminotransferase family protein [Cytobacillus pseudoceanisediminis]
MPNEEMLLIPGPTPVADSIYEAMAQETRGHTDPRFAAIYKSAIEKTREMLKTDGEVFVISGSGTIAMEMALVNTVAAGERLLIISQGFFGDRFQQLAKAFGIQAEIIQSEWGKQVDPAAVEEKLASHSYKAVTITHADTSTGVAADLDTLVPIIKKHGALVILDGVCATAAMEEDMSKSYGEGKIDVVLTGSQKAIGVPPGLAVVAFNGTALAAREQMERVPAYYCDIYNWIPIMHDPKKYFATPPVNLIYAYDEGMKLVLAEGMDNRYKRHEAYGKAVRAALAEYGMRAIADENAAAATLSCILYPEGMDDAEFRASLAKKGVIVAGALAHLAGKAFRIGHMGITSEDMLEKAIVLIGETMNEAGFEADIQKAVDRFRELALPVA